MAGVSKTFGDWVKQANKTHEGKFTYKELFIHKGKPWLVAVCPNHGEFKINASSHASVGRGCKACGIEARSASARITFAEFLTKAKAVHEHKYEYVGMTEGRKGSESVITAVCSKHGKFEQLRSRHLNGSGCSACGFERTADSCRHSREDWMHKFREVHGETYTYPETFELGSESRIDITCPRHGIFNQALIRHSSGDGCPACGDERGGLSIRSNFYSAVERAQVVHENRYLYLGIFWDCEKSNVLSIKYLCQTHGYQEQVLKTHLRGHGCWHCALASRSESLRYVFDDVIQDFVETHGDRYTYKELIPSNAEHFAKVVAVCASHGEFTQLVSVHLSGCGCPSCGVRISKPNREIYEYLKSIGLTSELEYQINLPHNRKIFADIYVPEANLVIEHMGLRWHSSKFKSKEFLADRQKAVEGEGYSFIGIFGDEWQFRTSAVKSLLAARCGKLRSRVFARRCSVSEISRDSAKSFIDQHHVQGYNSYGAKYIALKHQEEVVAVAVITNQTSNRFATSNVQDWELARFCSSVRVVGGAGKILNYFQNLVPSAKRVVSFSDVRLFGGGMYAQLGFTLDSELPPDYRYVVGRNRKHKQGFQKSKLAQMFPDADMTKTEREIAEANGIYRIYDSGKLRWVKTL